MPLHHHQDVYRIINDITITSLTAMPADIILPDINRDVVVHDVLEHFHEHWLSGLAVRTPRSIELQTEGKHSRC